MVAQLPTPQTTRPRDVQVAEIGAETLVLRSRTWDRLKFEIEYARQRGTTANAYLIQGSESALLDPPGESFTDIFLEELHNHQYYQRLNYIVMQHVNSNRIKTLRKLLEIAPYATVLCSKPALNTLRNAMPERESYIRAVRDEEVLDLGGGHELQFFFLPTPRHPDALATFDTGTRILFTDKLLGAHVCDEELWDAHWRSLQADRKYYFDCLHAIQAPQVEGAIARLQPLEPVMYAPGHGPMVRHSLSRFTVDYQRWCEEQQSQDIHVALLYASAYGNTALMGQAIAEGLQNAGATVNIINCEFADPEDIARMVQRCDGFVVGSPTLGGHAPIQIQTALGIILSTATKTKVAGVFGSFGWSGEAIDLLADKLQDAGYRFGFEPLRVKFTPTPEMLEQCRATGMEFVQSVKKAKKVRAPRQLAAETQTDRTGQAVGRVTGSLCVVTAKDGDRDVGFLTSWVSQAGFTPPAITVAIPKEGFIERLTQPAAKFVLNVLKEGRTVRRHFQMAPVPGKDQFANLKTDVAQNGCVILAEALAHMECTVQDRMDCGDHWLLYALTESGKVFDATGMTAVQHRKSSSQY